MVFPSWGPFRIQARILLRRLTKRNSSIYPICTDPAFALLPFYTFNLWWKNHPNMGLASGNRKPYDHSYFRPRHFNQPVTFPLPRIQRKWLDQTLLQGFLHSPISTYYSTFSYYWDQNRGLWVDGESIYYHPCWHLAKFYSYLFHLREKRY